MSERGRGEKERSGGKKRVRMAQKEKGERGRREG
jgi:hypothetical protein